MKNKTTFFANSILSVVLAVCLMMCTITAFEINVNSLILITSSVIFTAVFSLISSLVASKRKFMLSIGVTSIVFVFTVLFSLEIILSQLNYAVNRVLSYYSKYLSVPSVVEISNNTAENGVSTITYQVNDTGIVQGTSDDATVLFVFISLILCGIFTVSLIRARQTFPVTIISVVSLIPCFVLVNTLPSLVAIVIVVAILLALYFTSFIRKNNPAYGGAVSIFVSVITLIAVIIACILNPVDGYERYEWQDNLLNYMQGITGITSSEVSNSDLNSAVNNIKHSVKERENLSNLKKFELKGEKIMKILSESDGKIYLKGTAYADYNDNAWTIMSKEQTENFPLDFEAFTMTKTNTDIAEKISIITENQDEIIYTPYYTSEVPSDFTAVGDVCIKNDSKLLSYDITSNPFNKSVDFFCNDNQKNREYEYYVYNTYLQLPESTKEAMYEILDNYGLTEISDDDIPQAVKETIINGATYSIEADTMPDGADFPIWFINSRKVGYCVHYATTATVMLRALGIPARYVTGYCVNADAGEWTTVTSDNAHAWVEYYDDETGWIPFEATPASFTPAVYPPTTASTQSTQPSYAANTTQPNTTVQSTTSVNSTLNSTNPTNSQNGEKNTEPPEFKFNLASVIFAICIAVIILIVLIILIRRAIILHTRKKHFYSGRTNTRAIYIYRYIAQLKCYSKNVVPDRINDIATKAKFSSHKLNSEEVNIIRKFADEERKELYNNSSKIKRLYFRFIKVL